MTETTNKSNIERPKHSSQINSPIGTDYPEQILSTQAFAEKLTSVVGELDEVFALHSWIYDAWIQQVENYDHVGEPGLGLYALLKMVKERDQLVKVNLHYLHKQIREICKSDLVKEPRGKYYAATSFLQ